MHAETSTISQNFLIMTLFCKAGEGIRTLDIQLGKLTLSCINGAGTNVSLHARCICCNVCTNSVCKRVLRKNAGEIYMGTTRGGPYVVCMT